jgi:hypothetical protein
MQGGLILRSSILTGGRLLGSAVDARHGQQCDRFRSRPFQNRTAGAGGGACCHDIVDQENPQTFERASTADAECAVHVLAALGVGEAGLGGGRTHAADYPEHGNLSPASNLRGDEIGLIESPLKAAAPMQRHRNDGVESFIERQRTRQEFTQRLGQRFHPTVLEEMNQFPQRAFIEAEAVGCIEASGAGATESAAAFQVEWESILKGSLALGAEVIGGKAGRRAQTRGAHGNARIAVKRRLTDAAFVGKEDRKKSVRNLP